MNWLCKFSLKRRTHPHPLPSVLSTTKARNWSSNALYKNKCVPWLTRTHSSGSQNTSIMWLAWVDYIIAGHSSSERRKTSWPARHQLHLQYTDALSNTHLTCYRQPLSHTRMIINWHQPCVYTLTYIHMCICIDMCDKCAKRITSPLPMWSLKCAYDPVHMACESCTFVCRLHYISISIIHTYLKTLNF